MNILPSLRTGTLVVAVAPHSAKEIMSTVVAELSLHGSVTVLDAGNRFMAYRVAQLIRRQSLEVNQVSKRVFVRRAFTCYQVVKLLEETPAFNQPYLILDLLATFYDDQVSLSESRRLLKMCLKEIDRLRFIAPVAISLSPTPVNEKSCLVDELCLKANHVFAQEQTPYLEERQMVLF